MASLDRELLWLDDIEVGRRYRTNEYQLSADEIIEFAQAQVTGWLSGPSSKAVDLPAVALRRAAGSAVTDGEQRAKRVLVRWWRTAIVKAVDGDHSTHPLRDQLGHVDDPLALVDACLHVIAHFER
jgi:hypothetical protein